MERTAEHGGTTAGEPARAARSVSTDRDYEADWVRFGLWCAVTEHEVLPASPATVAAYVVHLAPVWRAATALDPPEAVVRGESSGGEVCQRPGLAPGTLVRHLAAIAAHHRAAGHRSPTEDAAVVDALARSRRRAGHRTTWRVAPAVTEKMRALVSGLDTARDPAAARDAALLLVGYTAALRRRELAALTLDQVGEDPAGEWIEVAAAPTDPGGAGHYTRVPAVGGDACPVAAWACWRGWLDDRPGDTDTDTDTDGGIGGRTEGRTGGSDGVHPGGRPAPAFRQIRKGVVDPRLDAPDARAAASRRIGTGALTERSIARILGLRAEAAGLLGAGPGRSLRQGLGITAD